MKQLLRVRLINVNPIPVQSQASSDQANCLVKVKYQLLGLKLTASQSQTKNFSDTS